MFVAGLLLEDDFGSLRVVDVVKELGLITCERSESCQGKTPHLAEAQWLFPSVVHMEEELQDRVQVEKGKRSARCRRDTRKGTRRGTEKQRTNAQPLIMDDHACGVMRTNTFLSQFGVTHHQCAHCAGEKMTCEVFLSTFNKSLCPSTFQ